MIREIFTLYLERWDFFLELFLQHLSLTAMAVGIITVLGLLAGILMTWSPLLAGLFLRITSFLYTIPSIALFGLLVSITGIGLGSALIVIVLYGLLPMIRNTYTGIQEVDPEILEAAQGMGSTPLEILWRIRLPLALPVIYSGFRTMVVMTISLGGIASFIGAGGLGVAIWRGISINQLSMTAAGSLLIALLAIAADLILERLERPLRKKYVGDVNK